VARDGREASAVLRAEGDREEAAEAGGSVLQQRAEAAAAGDCGVPRTQLRREHHAGAVPQYPAPGPPRAPPSSQLPPCKSWASLALVRDGVGFKTANS
jgi:hypothetical protein